MFKLRIALLIALFNVLLTSCASVPISTMAHFSGFDESNFLQIDPAKLRVKAQINSSAKVDLVKATKLSAGLEDENGRREFVFPLEIISKNVLPGKSGVFTDTPAFDVYTLKLSAAGNSAFKDYQHAASHGGPKRGSFTAGLNIDKAFDTEEEIYFTVALKLPEEDDYLTLVDNWKVEF